MMAGRLSGEPSRSYSNGAFSSLSRPPSCCSAKNQAELACRVQPLAVANTTRLPARLHHQLWCRCRAWANPSWQEVHLPVVNEGRRQRGARRGCARQRDSRAALRAAPWSKETTRIPTISDRKVVNCKTKGGLSTCLDLAERSVPYRQHEPASRLLAHALAQ